MDKQADVLIIGGGLSGLYLAYLLQKQGYQPLVLEASARLGGRIQTVKGELETPLELGATWFSDQHPNLLALLAELGLRWFPQYAVGSTLFQTKSFEPVQEFVVPESAAPSFRVVGGTQQLPDALAARLPAERLLLQKRVVHVRELDHAVEVLTEDGSQYQGAFAVVCTPPQLAASVMQFEPALPAETTQLLGAVHTWMAGSVKFAVEYPRAFWRAQGKSGMVYSHAGIITEMYDHTNFEANRFGLTGFLGGGAAGFEPAVRKELVLKQLVALLGEEAGTPTTYRDKVWNEESLVVGSPLIRYPHQYNGHPLLQQPYLGGKLYFCGTEAATAHGGYMEGAVMAVQRLADKLVQQQVAS